MFFSSKKGGVLVGNYSYHKVYYLASNFLNQSVIVILPILALKLFDDPYFVAQIGLYETIAGLLFGIVAVVCIDYLKNKFFVVTFSGALTLSLVLFYLYSKQSMLIFMLLMVMFLFFSRLIISIQNAIMFKKFSEKTEGIANYNMFTTSTYIILSIMVPPISLYLFNLSGLTFILILSFILVISSLFFEKAKYNIQVKESIFLDFKQNITVFFSNPDLYTPILMLASIIFSGIMVTTIYYIYIINTLELDNITYTLLLTVQSIGSLISSIFLYKRFFTNRIKVLPIATFLLALSYMAFLGVYKNVYLLLIVSLFSGVLVTIIQMLVSEQYQKNCPPDLFGTINGIRVTLNNIAGLLGAGVASLSYAYIGTYGIYAINIVLLMIIALVTLKKYKIKFRRGPL
ncbi:MFS transporter [Listeria monocytogenes]|nr:MFS transporter [Listeria monocytogenes]